MDCTSLSGLRLSPPLGLSAFLSCFFLLFLKQLLHWELDWSLQRLYSERRIKDRSSKCCWSGLDLPVVLVPLRCSHALGSKIRLRATWQCRWQWAPNPTALCDAQPCFLRYTEGCLWLVGVWFMACEPRLACLAAPHYCGLLLHICGILEVYLLLQACHSKKSINTK